MKKRESNLAEIISEFSRFANIPHDEVTDDTKLGPCWLSFVKYFCRKYRCVVERASPDMTLQELAGFAPLN